MGLLVLSAFYSGSEAAIFHIPRFTRKKLLQERKRIPPIENPENYLVTILFGNTLVNLGISILTTSLILNIFRKVSPVQLFIITIILTYFIIVFGEVTPKTYSIRNSTRVALKVSSVLEFFYYLYLPLTFLINKLMSLLKSKKDVSFSRHEFKEVIKIAEEDGYLDKNDRIFIERVLELKEKSVKEIMTPKINIESFPADISFESARDKIVHSRVPVYQNEYDNIIGILYLKDLLVQKKEGKVKEIVRECLKIPITMKTDELFSIFKEKGIHIGIVVDENERVAGLVTLDDILEDIVLVL